MSNTDVIILAAGRNARLEGIVPPFHKPLLVVNGQPLIASIVRGITGSRIAHGLGTINVVCAPQNAVAISSVLPLNMRQTLRMLVQREPDGVLNGLRVGLSVVDPCRRVIVVCADNLIPEKSWQHIGEYLPNEQLGDRIAVHGRKMSAREATRFTFHLGDAQGWNEKDEDALKRSGEHTVFCWIGPIVGPKKMLDDAVTAFTSANPGVDNSVGRVLNYVKGEVINVEDTVIDIGLPEVLP